jgi:hypothetical protein
VNTGSERTTTTHGVIAVGKVVQRSLLVDDADLFAPHSRKDVYPQYGTRTAAFWVRILTLSMSSDDLPASASFLRAFRPEALRISCRRGALVQDVGAFDGGLGVCEWSEHCSVSSCARRLTELGRVGDLCTDQLCRARSGGLGTLKRTFSMTLQLSDNHSRIARANVLGAEGSLELELVALEEDVVEAPGLCRQPASRFTQTFGIREDGTNAVG